MGSPDGEDEHVRNVSLPESLSKSWDVLIADNILLDLKVAAVCALSNQGFSLPAAQGLLLVVQETNQRKGHW